MPTALRLDAVGSAVADIAGLAPQETRFKINSTALAWYKKWKFNQSNATAKCYPNKLSPAHNI